VGNALPRNSTAGRGYHRPERTDKMTKQQARQRGVGTYLGRGRGEFPTFLLEELLTGLISLLRGIPADTTDVSW